MMKIITLILFLILPYSLLANYEAVFFRINKFTEDKDCYLLEIIHTKQSQELPTKKTDTQLLNEIKNIIENDITLKEKYKIADNLSIVEKRFVLIKLGSFIVAGSNNNAIKDNDLDCYDFYITGNLSFSKTAPDTLNLNYSYFFDLKKIFDSPTAGSYTLSERGQTGGVTDIKFGSLNFLAIFSENKL